jgi:hypothetical protein
VINPETEASLRAYALIGTDDAICEMHLLLTPAVVLDLLAGLITLRADRDVTQAKFDGTVRALGSVILERDKLQNDLNVARDEIDNLQEELDRALRTLDEENS